MSNLSSPNMKLTIQSVQLGKVQTGKMMGEIFSRIHEKQKVENGALMRFIILHENED
ncbi:hypothetical protein FACS18949_10940 [Clostridia bacterium]|nr:hypothetical protein FACS18949_10940 [Clostridia bacterium]